jgi:hypothetical protein
VICFRLDGRGLIISELYWLTAVVSQVVALSKNSIVSGKPGFVQGWRLPPRFLTFIAVGAVVGSCRSLTVAAQQPNGGAWDKLAVPVPTITRLVRHQNPTLGERKSKLGLRLQMGRSRYGSFQTINSR